VYISQAALLIPHDDDDDDDPTGEEGQIIMDTSTMFAEAVAATSASASDTTASRILPMPLLCKGEFQFIPLPKYPHSSRRSMTGHNDDDNDDDGGGGGDNDNDDNHHHDSVIPTVAVLGR
jgi:hypothetical protein